MALISHRKIASFRFLLRTLGLPERKGRNSEQLPLGVGKWSLLKGSDYFLQLLANFGIVLGAVLILTCQPSLQNLLAPPSEPSAGDFLMAAGLMVHISLALGGWRESGSSVRRRRGSHCSRVRSASIPPSE